MSQFILSILVGYLLFTLAFTIYWLAVRTKATPEKRKTFLRWSIVFSLVLPFFLGIIQQQVHIPNLFGKKHEHEAVSKASNHVFDEHISSCYEIAITQDEFCQCEEVLQENIVLYESKLGFDYFIRLKNPIIYLFAAFAGIFSILFFIRLGYLFWIVKKSQKEKISFEGKTFDCLKGNFSIKAASFVLGKKYILWDHSLDAFPTEKQNAILAHEVAHLENGHSVETYLVHFLQVLWFLNPTYYLAKNEFDLINEFIADREALKSTGNKIGYASLLLELGQTQKLGFANQFAYNPLKSRMIQILEPKPNSDKGVTPFLISSVILMLISIGSIGAITNRQSNALLEYQMIKTEHEATGHTFFCKSCLIEKFEKDRGNCE